MRPSSSSYTCRRCLQALGNARGGSQTSVLASRLALGQRTISTKNEVGLNGSEQLGVRPARKAMEKRMASSFGQNVKNEPPEFRTPPGMASTPPPKTESRPLLLPNNLFHPFSESPSPEIRRRAAFIKQNAFCPHPDHRQSRLPMNPDDPEARKSSQGGLAPAHVSFECPDCGIPVSCSEDHWADDYESHLEICDTLKEINEDDHDLRSGRFFPEFEYPGDQMEEAMVNMTNWDTFLYSREFRAINDDRSLRQATRLLTYPVTIGSVLHELSPYSIKQKGRLTVEGLKSLSALRYSLHPPRNGGGSDIKGLRPTPPPMRIFILGARAESSLPREVWVQLTHLFPRVAFHLVFIGPESMANRDAEFPLPERTPSNPYGAIVEDRITNSLKISTFVEYYHTLHKAGHFYPYDPYFDCFMLFHPGLGHPASSHEWQETIPQLLETKVPILVTGYTQYDMERDIDWVKKTVGGEMDMLMEPGENRFRSLRWDLNDLDPQDISCGNWGVWGFRGKRYETTRKDSEE
ncbi:Mitochondrial protein MSS51 [Lachnellula arida]|uniref:Mitochondrial protein MSS51 n=1 Tax=Lachnellula arida TaxID=1316785 RepID=A0A8T9BTZ3_9HELO|nr:Mitochondrial protein MSS51 [Lachnellula arida]